MRKKDSLLLREKLKFIIGINDLNDKELKILHQNLVSILGARIEGGSRSVIIVSKDLKQYEMHKNIYICCGCAEFKIPIKKYYLFLAIDY